MEIGVHAAGDLRFLPYLGVDTETRLEVELDQGGFTGVVDHAEGVDAEALHGAEGTGDSAVRHVPESVVRGLGVQAHEVPEGVVRTLRLGDLPVRVRFGGVDDIGKLDAVLDEEDRDVVAHQVPGALVGVELHAPAARVAHGVGGTAGTQHGGEPHEDGGLLALGKHAGLGDRGGFAVGDEHAVGASATGVDHALRDPLVVEVGDLLAEVVVLHEQGATLTRAQRMAGLAQARTLRCGEVLALLGAGVGLTGSDVEGTAGRRVGGRGSLGIRRLRGSGGGGRLGNLRGVAARGTGGRVTLRGRGGLRGLVLGHYLLLFKNDYGLHE